MNSFILVSAVHIANLGFIKISPGPIFDGLQSTSIIVLVDNAQMTPSLQGAYSGWLLSPFGMTLSHC
jgi:hypothetical protein